MLNINQRKISINKIKDLLSAVMLTALLGMLFIVPIFCSSTQAALIILDTKVQVSAAVTKIWDGNAAESFAGGKGTKESPYQIAEGKQLAYLAKEVNQGNAALNASSVYYILTNDIYLNGTAGWENWADENPDNAILNIWTPIGKSGNEFVANFDGKNFAVYGVYINVAEGVHQGLFGRVKGGKISNLGIKESYINGKQGVGGIAGEIIGDGSAIINCFNSGNVSSISNVGGIVGYVSSGSILINSYNTGSVTCGTDNAGGVAGNVRGLVANCYNTGDVSAEGWTVGGVAGYLVKVEESSSTISNCYSTGKISGKGQAGGIIGVVGSGSFAYYCYYLKTTEINKDLPAANGDGTILNVSAFDKTGALASPVTVCGTEYPAGSLLTDALNAYVSYENKNNSGVFCTWEGQPFPRHKSPVPSGGENGWKWFYTLIIIFAVIFLFAAGTAVYLVYRKKAKKARKHPALLPEVLPDVFATGLTNSHQILPDNAAAVSANASLSASEVEAVRIILQDKNGLSSDKIATLTLPEDFTLREREIAGLILEGKKAKEIAVKLFISTTTVKNHIQNILRKSGCSDQLSFVVKYSGFNGRTQA